MAEARQVAGLKLAVKPDGKIEIDWSSGKKSKLRSSALFTNLRLRIHNKNLLIFYS